MTSAEEKWLAGGAVLIVGYTFADTRGLFDEWYARHADGVEKARVIDMTIRSKLGGIALFVSRDVDPARLRGLQLDGYHGAWLTRPGAMEVLQCRLRGPLASL